MYTFLLRIVRFFDNTYAEGGKLILHEAMDLALERVDEI